jgi:hypothetical protein
MEYRLTSKTHPRTVASGMTLPGKPHLLPYLIYQISAIKSSKIFSQYGLFSGDEAASRPDYLSYLRIRLLSEFSRMACPRPRRSQ